jgi:hypothetical protein
MPQPTTRPPLAVVGDTADNGYSSDGIREGAHPCNGADTPSDDCTCPVCKLGHPAPSWRLNPNRIATLCRWWLDGDYVAEDGSPDALGFLYDLGDEDGVLSFVACTCPGCGWHHMPAPVARWRAAARALAEGRLPESPGAGARGQGAPGHDPAPGGARVPVPDAARMATSLVRPAAPAAADGAPSALHAPETLTELLARIEESDERIEHLESTTGHLALALADERGTRTARLEQLVGKLRALEAATHGPTGHEARIEDMGRELAALRGTLQDTNTGAVLVMMSQADQLRALAKRIGALEHGRAGGDA